MYVGIRLSSRMLCLAVISFLVALVALVTPGRAVADGTLTQSMGTRAVMYANGAALTIPVSVSCPASWVTDSMTLGVVQRVSKTLVQRSDTDFSVICTGKTLHRNVVVLPNGRPWRLGSAYAEFNYSPQLITIVPFTGTGNLTAHATLQPQGSAVHVTVNVKCDRIPKYAEVNLTFSQVVSKTQVIWTGVTLNAACGQRASTWINASLVAWRAGPSFANVASCDLEANTCKSLGTGVVAVQERTTTDVRSSF